MPPTDGRNGQWQALRRAWFALAVALFPFIFILDAALDPAVSPVLPGMAALLALWILGPYLSMEVLRRHDADPATWTTRSTRARYAEAGAFTWFLVWLVFLA